MKNVKNLTHYSLLIFILFLGIISCKNSDNAVKVEELFNGNYVKGEIFRPFKMNSPNGLIRVFINDYEGENKRLLVVPFEEGNNLLRFDTVYFKVKKYDNLFCAFDIHENVPTGATVVTNMLELENLFINFHAGHPEEGQHRKIHVIGPSVPIPGTSLSSITTYQVNSDGTRASSTNSTLYVYSTEFTLIDTTLDYYSSVIAREGSYDVSRLTTNHTH